MVEWRLYQCGAYHEDDAAFGFGRLTGDGTARLFCVITFNAPSNCDNKEKEGPPATGKGTLLGVRLQPALLGRLDEWAESQEDKPSRPEAIRRLVEKALPPVTPKRTSPPGERTAKATKLAEEQVDRLIDPALPPEERERTKRRLIKGPKEFRDVRDRAKR